MTKLEMFNEIIIMGCAYFMMCYTDWIPKAETRYIVGWYFIALILVHVGTHMSFLVVNTITAIKQKSRDKYLKRKNA